MAEREWVLLNPGPANTSPSVREALVMPDLCHREPECFDMMRRCRDAIVRLAGDPHLFVECGAVLQVVEVHRDGPRIRRAG